MNNKELLNDVVKALRDLGYGDNNSSVRAQYLLKICETEEQVLKHLNKEYQVRGIE